MEGLLQGTPTQVFAAKRLGSILSGSNACVPSTNAQAIAAAHVPSPVTCARHVSRDGTNPKP